MLKIEARRFELLEGHYDAVVVTSANALEHIPQSLKDVPLYCVGAQTSAKAQERGFGAVQAASKTVSDLTDHLIETCEDQSLKFCYFRGEDISFDLKTSLSDHAHKVDEYICYSALECDEMPLNVVADIKGGHVQIVTLFSKRTAENFARLIADLNLMDYMTGITVICVSEGVLECIDHIFQKRLVSKTPDACGMRDAVRVLYSK